jgi:hypothetical protein
MGWGADEGCTPRPPIRAQPAPARRVLAVLFLGLLLDLLAFTLLLPLLPALLDSHGRAHVRPRPPPEPPAPGAPRSPRPPCPMRPLSPRPSACRSRLQDPLYGSWQRWVDWFATAIGMPAEKRYNSVLFGGRSLSARSRCQSPSWGD